MNLLPSSYVAIDFESTGRNPETAGIVEIGVATVRDDVIVEQWATFADPGIPCSEGAAKVHGITPNQIASAQPIADLLPELIEGWLSDGLPVIAHNANQFDRPLLLASCKRAGIPAPDGITWLDTLQIARKALPGRSHALGHIGSHLGVVSAADALHRAGEDIRVLVGIIPHLRRLQIEQMQAVVPAPVRAPSTMRIVSAVETEVAESELAPIAPPDLLTRAKEALVAPLTDLAEIIVSTQEIACETEGEDRKVVDAIVSLRKLHKRVEVLRGTFTDEIGKLKRDIEAVYRENVLKRCDAMVATLEDLRKPRQLRLAREAAEAAEAQRREAEAIAEAERQRLIAEQVATAEAAALDAVLAGDMHAAEAATEAAQAALDSANDHASAVYEQVITQAAAIVPPPVRSGSGTSRSAIAWKFTITNPFLVPRLYCSPDTAKIQAAIDAANGQATIPGIEIEQDVKTTVRSGR